MRFLVDECTGPAVGSWLHGNGYEVFSVFEKARGMNDDDIINAYHTAVLIKIHHTIMIIITRMPAGISTDSGY